MLDQLKIELMNENRAHVLSILTELEKRKGQKLRVLDIGGSCNDWCPFTTHIADNVAPNNKSKIFFPVDLDAGDDWNYGLLPIMSDINIYGKFDFLICTHTLEDLHAPWICANKFSALANLGFVAVPSKYRELTRFSYNNFIGYDHHRWIFTVKKGLFCAFPKIGLLEHGYITIPNIQKYYTKYNQDQHTEMTFIWKDELRIQKFNAWDYTNARDVNLQFAKTMLELNDDLDFIL